MVPINSFESAQFQWNLVVCNNYNNSIRMLEIEIVENIISGKQSLAIMPTGAGKSLCYQLPAIISPKKTIIISPLIALIDDQVASLKECGVNSFLTFGVFWATLFFTCLELKDCRSMCKYYHYFIS